MPAESRNLQPESQTFFASVSFILTFQSTMTIQVVHFRRIKAVFAMMALAVINFIGDRSMTLATTTDNRSGDERRNDERREATARRKAAERRANKKRAEASRREAERRDGERRDGERRATSA